LAGTLMGAQADAPCVSTGCWVDPFDLHSNPVHMFAGCDVERSAIVVTEGDIGRADLRLRFAGRHGQFEHAKTPPIGCRDAYLAWTRPARRI
jgi:hypothetical protein